MFPHENTASARLNPHPFLDALTGLEPSLPLGHLAFSKGGSASPSESETTVQARWVSTSLTQTAPLFLNVVGIGCQPQPCVDYQESRTGEVFDYEFGQERAEPIKHSSVTRDLPSL